MATAATAAATRCAGNVDTGCERRAGTDGSSGGPAGDGTGDGEDGGDRAQVASGARCGPTRDKGLEAQREQDSGAARAKAAMTIGAEGHCKASRMARSWSR
jgi:hypothetical protein